MPFSNQKNEGFENKIADLLGKTLNIPVTYYWFPQATGFIRNTLRAKRCDIVIGYAQGHELVQNTNHYYNSAYVLVTRKDGDLTDVESLDDPRLKGRKIGVIAGTPPATNLAVNGLLPGVRAFQLNVDRRFYSPAEDMVKLVASGELDAGLLWGPIGGYYAKQEPEKLKITPLVKEKGGPRMVYRITMGVRPTEQDWKRQLNRLIREKKEEIDGILRDYGVPLVDG
jgi:quinoprotein dehydrogenase-associated probable ABC transporter substrate-binding protein